MVRFRRLAAVGPVLAALVLGGCASDGGDVQSQKLATIKGRGTVVCGVDGKLPGFSFVPTNSRLSSKVCCPICPRHTPNRVQPSLKRQQR